jgi:hypothetical protein
MKEKKNEAYDYGFVLFLFFRSFASFHFNFIAVISDRLIRPFCTLASNAPYIFYPNDMKSAMGNHPAFD